jgi:hypothetical protein
LGSRGYDRKLHAVGGRHGARAGRFMIVGSFDRTATETAHDHDAGAERGRCVAMA